MVPTIDGTMHHFDNVGLYDALFVMQDQETKTLWNHISGEALYGPLVGRTLGPVGNFLQMSVEQALLREPMTSVAISDSPYFVNGQPFGRDGPIAGGRGRGRGAGGGGRLELDDPNASLRAGFIDTLGTEDTRLERMEMGLGVVIEDTVRFYPMNVIRERGALVDTVDGRNVLIFIDQSTFTPAALFVDASSATLEDREIHLDTGGVVRMGALFDAAGDQVDARRPQQLFSRWYGFALTFPGPQIFGQ